MWIILAKQLSPSPKNSNAFLHIPQIVWINSPIMLPLDFYCYVSLSPTDKRVNLVPIPFTMASFSYRVVHPSQSPSCSQYS